MSDFRPADVTSEATGMSYKRADCTQGLDKRAFNLIERTMFIISLKNRRPPNRAVDDSWGL